MERGSGIPVEQLKKAIHKHLNERGLMVRIQETLAQMNKSGQGLDEGEVLRVLKQERIFEDVVHSFTEMQLGGTTTLSHLHFSQKDVKPSSIKSEVTVQYLQLHVNRGRAFVEHLLEPSLRPGQSKSLLRMHISFLDQRKRSRPVAATCDPVFNQAFNLQIPRAKDGSTQDVNSLLVLNQPIHLVLVKEAPDESIVLSSHILEWRPLLSSRDFRFAKPLELNGIGSESKVPVGMLEIEIRLIPQLSNSLSEDVVNAQVTLERSRRTERDRLFLAYAKLWWKEFCDIRVSNSQRLVKIFAQDENGNVHPVTRYVQPFRTEAAVENSRVAAWMVSLLRHDVTQNVGAAYKQEHWRRPFTFLSTSAGSVEDHAVMLCSLFLGFGMDAFVCLGTISGGMSYAWVLTKSTKNQIIFWDSLTSTRFCHYCIANPGSPEVTLYKPKHPFKSIGCIFNNTYFFANCQSTDSVDLCNFNLFDSSCWKSMSEDAMSLARKDSFHYPPLVFHNFDSRSSATDMEMALRSLIAENRAGRNLSTYWDEELCYLLMPALATYENQGRTGMTGGDEEFRDAIYRAIPHGHTFKALPIHFLQTNPKNMLMECLRTSLGEEIVGCHGDQVRMAVRVQVYVYPESILSVWVMIAVRYKRIC